MRISSPLRHPRLFLTVTALTLAALPAGAQSKRPMTFLDVQNMRQVGTPDVSADGHWMLYTLSVPDWKEARRQSDIFVVNTDRGLASARQLTFTKDKTETNPRWSHDGSSFSSSRRTATRPLVRTVPADPLRRGP